MLLIFSAHASANWRYEADTDAMTGKKSATAYIVSNNSLSLGFPYRGKNHATMIVRQHPKFGLDVIFQIEQGQILCRSYGDDCSVMVRFDDKPPVRFSAVGPADHSSTSVFLQARSKFIADAKRAKRILVQPTLYQNGSPVLEFTTVQPLDWPIGGSSKKK
jgi:hypothetical protein